MKNFLPVLFAATLAALPVLADPKDDEITALKNEVAALRAETQSLRKMLAEPVVVQAPAARTNQVVVVVKQEVPEIELLRAECQALRKMLATPLPPPLPRTPPPAASDDNAPPLALHAAGTHWLTLSTEVRHNARCPNFQRTIGNFCGPEIGRACRICGG